MGYILSDNFEIYFKIYFENYFKIENPRFTLKSSML